MDDRTSLPLVRQPLSYSAVLQAPRPVYPSIQVPAVSVSAPLVHPVESLQGSGLVPLGYEKSGSWSCIKRLMAMRPKIKFSGRNKAMDFEEFMKKMEKAMSQEGVTDDVRVSELEEWFVGEALEVVQAVKRGQVEGEAEVVLRKVKEELTGYFGTQVFKTGERLKELMKGGLIGKGDHGGIRAWMISLQGVHSAAESKGGGYSAAFSSNEMYLELLRARVPHLIPKWTKEFEDDRRGREVSFSEFKDFVLKVSKLDEKILGNTLNEGSKSVTNQKFDSFNARSAAYNPFASGHPDASANGRDNHVHSRPRSPPRELLGFCFYCSKEHQLGDCEEFKALGLDARVDFCRSRRVCYKCLNNVYHNFSSCEFKSRCETCLAPSHHTLLHGMRRFHSLPGSSTLPKSDS
jgi:hypothetical protein